jgi:DNA-binding PadR family transcriptional regulator
LFRPLRRECRKRLRSLPQLTRHRRCRSEPPKTPPETAPAARALIKERMPSRQREPVDLDLNATAATILGFLDREPLTGWELAAHIEEIVGDFWNVTRSQIYRELKALAEQGLVASMKTGPRDRQPYRITEAGRRAFRGWIARSAEPPTMRIPLVLQVFFGDAVPAETLRQSLDDMRRYHAGRLDVYRLFEARIAKGTRRHDALRLGLMFQRTMIAWIDSLRPEGRGRRSRGVLRSTTRPSRSRSRSARRAPAEPSRARRPSRAP